MRIRIRNTAHHKQELDEKHASHELASGEEKEEDAAATLLDRHWAARPDAIGAIRAPGEYR